MKLHCFLLLLLALVSCRSVSSVQEVRSSEVQKFRSVDTIVVRDSVVLRDSVILRERTIHDTVYITKEIYRDTHNSSLITRNSAQADTVRVVEYQDRVIEHPPKRYVPKFYKHCTIYFWCAIVLLLLYIVFRITTSKLLRL